MMHFCHKVGLLGLLAASAFAADPTAPTSVWVTSKTSTAVTMTWYGAGDVDGDIARYRISRDGAEVGASTTTTWTDSGLQAATTYVYTIVVEDAGGRRSPSGPAMTAVTRPLGYMDPSAPTGVSVSGVSAHAATLTWTPTADLDPIVRYLVSVDGVLTATAPTPPILLTNLANGTRSFSVKAEDSLGNQSPFSTAATAVIPGDTTAPTPPVTVTVGAVTPGSIMLSWSPGTDDTGVIAYRVQYSRNGVAVAQHTTSALGYLLGVENGTPLVPGSNYSITVSSVDRSNLETAATAVSATTPADTTPPDTPTAPRVNSASFMSLVLEWANDGDDVKVVSWELSRDGQVIATTASTTYTDVVITPGLAYSYTLVAIDGAGNRSGASAPLEVTCPSEDLAPPAPLGVRVTARSATTLTLDWQQDADPGDSGVVAWSVERDGVVVADRITSKPWTDLAPAGLAHTWSVIAIDRCGNRSPPSTPLTLQRGGDLTSPNAPLAPTLGAATITTAVLNWTPVADAVGYDVLRDGNRVGDAVGTSWTDTTRSPATTVAYAVVAYDAAGNRSAPSATVSSTTPADATLPSKPVGLVKSVVTSNGFTLTWTASTDNHVVASYEVLRAGIVIATVPTPAAVLTNLPVGASAAYTVRSIDPSGNKSAVSTALTVATLADTTAPSLPQKPWTTSVAPASVALAWMPCDDDVAVTMYEVRRDGVVIGTTANALFTDATVVEGTKPAYALVAMDAAGNRTAVGEAAMVAVPLDPARDRVAPSAPANLRLGGRTEQSVTVAWDAAVDDKPTGIARYHVFQDGSEVTTTTSLTAALTGLTPEQVVSVTIRAEDQSGNVSAHSTVGIFSALGDGTAPSAPGGLVVNSVGVSSVDLGWQASTDNVGVTSYDVLLNGTWLLTVGGTTATVTGLPANTTGYFAVRAVDLAGNRSASSASITAKTLVDTEPPTAVSTLAASAVTAGAATLTWDAATDNVAVTGYEIYKGAQYLGTTTDRLYRLTGLSASTPYSCTIRACDGAGLKSLVSNAATFTTLADAEPPAAPFDLLPSGLTYTNCNVSWSAPSDNVAVTNYRVYRDGAQVASLGANWTTLTGLTPGVSYAITVKAEDAVGNLSISGGPIVITPPMETQAPAFPGNLWISSRTASSATLSWNAAADPGGSGVVSYRVYRDGVQVGTTATTSNELTGLQSGVPYQLTVVAIDAAGNTSLPTPALGVTLGSDATLPTPVIGLASNNITQTTVDLSWSASTDNVGVVAYRVFRAGEIVAVVQGTSFTHTGILPGSGAYYSIESIDAAANRGQGGAWLYVTALADTLAPTTPGQPTATGATARSVTLTWPAATDVVGVKEYVVYRNGGQVGIVAATAFTDSALAPLQSYSFTVAARDYSGNLSAQSSALVASTLPDTTAPAQPGLPRFVLATATTVRVAWSVGSDDSGTVSYELLRDGVVVQATSYTQIDDAGLIPGTTYVYTLVARDAAGNRSSASPAMTASTRVDVSPPTQPMNLATSQITDSSVRLDWYGSSDADSAVAEYRILANGTDVAGTPGGYFLLTDLAPNTTYGIAIQAVDMAGNRSALSNAVQLRTQVDMTKPRTPTVRATPTAPPGLVLYQATWDAVQDPSGIASYEVAVNGESRLTTTGTTANLGVLRAGSNYRIAARAVDGRGNIGDFGFFDVVTPPDVTPPSTPSGLTATQVDLGTVALTWSPSTDDNGILRYLVYRNGTRLGSVSEPAYTDASAPASSCSYQVEAIDLSGNASALSPAQVLLVAGDMQAPQRTAMPTITAVGWSTVSLSWTPSWDRIGVVDYEILRDGSVVGTSASASWTDTQCTPAAIYQYAIVARDAAGNRSSVSKAVTVRMPIDVTPPASPTGVMAQAIGTAWHRIAWQSASDGTGSGVSMYEVAVDGAVVAATDARQAMVGPLTGPTARLVTVRARDLAGNWSAWSSPYRLVPRDAAANVGAPAWNMDLVAPTAPGSAQVALTAEHTATVTWSASTDAGGIAGYLIYRLPSGGSPTCIGFSETLAFVDGLVPGNVAQTWQIQGVDRFGQISTTASTAAATLPSDVTPPPAARSLRVAFVDPATRRARITWESEGANDLQAWRVSGLSTPLPAATRGVDLGVTLGAGLIVQAVDFHGRTGDASIQVPVPADVEAPVAPLVLRGDAVLGGGVLLRWSSGWDSTSASLTYVIERDGTALTEMGRAYQSWTDPSPPPGRTLQYRLLCRDAAGNRSPTAAECQVLTAADTTPPTPPAVLTWSSRSETTIALHWTAGGDGPNQPAPTYEVLRDGKLVATLAANIRNWTDNDLVPDQSYTYSIVAVDVAGNRGTTAAALRTLPSAVPLPRNLRMQGATLDRVVLAWDPPYDVAGLTKYVVSYSSKGFSGSINVAPDLRLALVPAQNRDGGGTITVQGTDEARATGTAAWTMPMRSVSMLERTAGFDPARWNADAGYRQTWLSSSDPARIWRPAEPGPGVLVLRSGSGRRLAAAVSGTVELVVQGSPTMPVTFVCLDGGVFAATGTSEVTVQADASGRASAVLGGFKSTGICAVLAASPAASGHVRFIVRVQP